MELANSKVIITSNRNWLVDYRMLGYLLSKGIPFHNISVVNSECSVTEIRNRTVRDLVLPRCDKVDWFVFLDQDHFPSGATDAFFEPVDADIVGCGYNTGNDQTWLDPTSFHMGACRIKGSFAAQLELPWFNFVYTTRGTELLRCECSFLREKALQAGAVIKRQGWIEHDSKHSWHGTP